MKTVPLMCEGRMIGKLQIGKEGEDTVFSACGKTPRKGLWCLWAIGESQKLRLGCPENRGEEFCLSRRFSSRMTVSVGEILRGELRTVQAETGWETLRAPEQFFRSEDLRRGLREHHGILAQQNGTLRLLAIPFSTEGPFPLTGLFCFARIRRIRDSTYAVFTFRGEEPVLQNMEN